MTKFSRLAARLLLLALLPLSAFSQTTNLSINASTKRLVQPVLKFPSGSTITLESGATLDVTAGTVTGLGAGTVTSVGQSFTGGLISVAGSPITTSGTLALTVAGISGGIPYFDSASTWTSSAALTANALMIGGGAGAAPSTTTTGAGILTFLGTPSSANLRSAVTDETGVGSLVFNDTASFVGTTDMQGLIVDGVTFRSSFDVTPRVTMNIFDAGSTEREMTWFVPNSGSMALTIPETTMTLVGTSTSQTLTNKTISLGSNTLTATSAQLAAALSDEAGSGAAVFATSPTITTPTFSGTTTLSGVLATAVPTMTGSAIDVTLPMQKATISGATTLTLSGTPATGAWFGFRLTESGGSARTITLPAGTWISAARGATITTFTLAANSTATLSVHYDGTSYYLFGDPATINDLTADATPDVTADYWMTWDTSASAHKRVLMNKLPTLTTDNVHTAGIQYFPDIRSTNQVWRFYQQSSTVGIGLYGAISILGFNSANQLTAGGMDTNLSRNSAGVIQFGTGTTANASGSIVCTNATFNGTLAVGGGTAIAKVLSASASIDFASMGPGAENTQTLTVTGVTTTNTPTVALGWDAALEDLIVVKQAWVSGANTVSIRVANVSSASTIDPAARTARATVMSY